MLDAGSLVVRENMFPVDDAAADVSHVWHFLNGARGGAFGALGKHFHVLDVDEREAAGIFIEIFDGIFAGHRNPAEVEFHLDVIGIGSEQNIVRKFSAKRIGRLKFESVIVIGKLNAGFFADFAGLLEKISGALVAIGFLALFGLNPRANDELVPNSM